MWKLTKFYMGQYNVEVLYKKEDDALNPSKSNRDALRGTKFCCLPQKGSNIRKYRKKGSSFKNFQLTGL